MTDTTDEALRGMIERATPGPWENPYGASIKGDGQFLARCDVLRRSLKDAGFNEAIANAALIVAAVNVLPKHLDTIAELRARVESEAHGRRQAEKLHKQWVEAPEGLKWYMRRLAEEQARATAAEAEVAKLREALNSVLGKLRAEQIDESQSPQYGEHFESWRTGYLAAIDTAVQWLAALRTHAPATEEEAE